MFLKKCLHFATFYKVDTSYQSEFKLMYRDSGNMHFSFFTIKFFPPTQKITIPKKDSVF